MRADASRPTMMLPQGRRCRGAIPARHLVIEIADFHNKICHKQKWCKDLSVSV
jgi:hypothetical protein